ncbi:MAG: methyltransferase domain-containing protein [Chloroflexota bacterium]
MTARPPTPSSPAQHARRVARYYDRNTRRFLALGGGGQAAAIHRQIWAPGVQTRAQAVLYLNEWVACAVLGELDRADAGVAQSAALPGALLEAAPVTDPAWGTQAAEALSVLDLGCGAGGTATWLAQRYGLQVTGVTISAVQQRLAERRARELGLQERCRFLQADYLDLPALGPFRAAIAIESFLHAADAGRFFQQAAAQLAPGGRLVLCDDFLAVRAEQGQATAWLERFRRGWQVGSLLPPPEVERLAQRAGLRLAACQDLSGWLRLHPPLRLALLGWITRLPLPGAYWQNLSGGTALQVCLQHGWTTYQALVFIKEAHVN